MLREERKHLLIWSFSAFDPSVWTGRALQAECEKMEGVGLAHLYPALAWSVCAPGHHGYPRAPDLILRKALRGRLGHQITGATARPFLHLLKFNSQTSAGIAVTFRGCAVPEPDIGKPLSCRWGPLTPLSTSRSSKKSPLARQPRAPSPSFALCPLRVHRIKTR